MSGHKIINIGSPGDPFQETLSQELGISKILSQILFNRGIRSLLEAQKFLKTNLDQLLDPFLFKDMAVAVELIRKACRNKDKVMIFGDYDVDGITSVAVLKNTLSGLGLEAEYYLPHRVKEGYGLTRNIASVAIEKKIKLLITVDCGISSFEQVKELREAGIEVIITDHHEPSTDQLPSASAIINPKVKNSGYPFRDLAGVGVAYKLSQALAKDNLAEELDLVCLGTIADVVGLVNENRVIAKFGLEQLSRTKRPGLQALIQSSRIKDKVISSTFVSYILAPRINASGRMDTSETSLKLLLSQDRLEADEIAASIESHNRQRQKIEAKILDEALALIDKEVNFKEHKIIVVAAEDWHHGVLGIVASKLADRFYRPTILISLGREMCKGSGRSIKNFHLFHALVECGEFLQGFGGHSHAVGLQIYQKNISDFRKKINQLASQQLKIEDLLPSLDIDMELKLEDISAELVRELSLLAPFGSGNPEPLFFTRGLQIKGQPQVLSRDTLKFWVSDGAITFAAIGFGMGSFRDSLISANSVDLVYNPQIDTWVGDDAVILGVKDIFFK